MEGGTEMTTQEAIETFGRLKHYIQTDVNRYGGGWDSIVEAIDTVLSELEKPLLTDYILKVQARQYAEDNVWLYVFGFATHIQQFKAQKPIGKTDIYNVLPTGTVNTVGI